MSKRRGDTLLLLLLLSGGTMRRAGRWYRVWGVVNHDRAKKGGKHISKLMSNYAESSFPVVNVAPAAT